MDDRPVWTKTVVEASLTHDVCNDCCFSIYFGLLEDFSLSIIDISGFYVNALFLSEQPVISAIRFFHLPPLSCYIIAQVLGSKDWTNSSF